VKQVLLGRLGPLALQVIQDVLEKLALLVRQVLLGRQVKQARLAKQEKQAPLAKQEKLVLQEKQALLGRLVARVKWD
jgi:hypothetical protein